MAWIWLRASHTRVHTYAREAGSCCTKPSGKAAWHGRPVPSICCNRFTGLVNGICGLQEATCPGKMTDNLLSLLRCPPAQTCPCQAPSCRGARNLRPPCPAPTSSPPPIPGSRGTQPGPVHLGPGGEARNSWGFGQSTCREQTEYTHPEQASPGGCVSTAEDKQDFIGSESVETHPSSGPRRQEAAWPRGQGVLQPRGSAGKELASSQGHSCLPGLSCAS